jgi:hypothetical protein
MPTIMDEADARKVARDASDDRARASANAAAAGRKTAHDASQPSGGTVRKVMAATGRDVIRQNAGTAEQHLQKAVDGLRGTMGRSAELVSNAADASQQVAQRSADEANQISTQRIEAAREVVSRTQQNLDVMLQTGSRLAGGFQAVLREWADYTRNAVQCNVDGVNSILRAQTLQELMAAQSDLLNAEVQVMLTSSVRISEATARVAKDVAQSIGERGRSSGTRRTPDGVFRRSEQAAPMGEWPITTDNASE